MGGSFQDVAVSKEVYITLGLFTIVQLQRKVQMMIPAYDFCIPDKESEYSTGDPCEMFKKIQFPMEDFFPPRLSEFQDNCDKIHTFLQRKLQSVSGAEDLSALPETLDRTT